MDNTITNRQMFFILVLTLTSNNVITIAKDMAVSAGTGAWLTLLATSVFFGLVAVVIVSLNNRFHGKTLFEYSAQLITRPGSYILICLYILYFLFITLLLVTQEAKVLKVDFFPKTPLWVFPALSLPVFCYIANKGITTIARLCEFIGIIFICTAVFVHILMLTEGKVNRILPLINPDEIGEYAKATEMAVPAFIPIGMLFAIPFTKKNGNKSKKIAFFSLIAIGLFYILIVISSIMKVGLNDIAHYEDSLIIAIRDTAPRFLEVITRLDILYLTVGFTGLFMGISVLLTAIVEFLCRMFKNVRRPVIVTIVGIVTFGLYLLTSGIRGYVEFSIESEVYFALVFSVVIPFILWVIAAVRKPKRKEKNNAA